MKTKPYEFTTKVWPPPKELQSKEHYLFGFDIDNQPYILRWESFKSDQGWCAVTLDDHPTNYNITADPRYLSPRDTNRRIVCWAEGPLLKSVVARRKAG